MHEKIKRAELRRAESGGHQHELRARRGARHAQRGCHLGAGREGRLVEQRRARLGGPQ